MLKILFVISAVIALSASSKVPALIWSENRHMSDIPQASLGSSVPTTEFMQDYLSPLTSDKDGGNLVVFMQDKLSLQDFSNHADVYNDVGDGGVFKNIKSFMDDLFSVHLSAVTTPKKGIDDLKKKFDGKVHEVKKDSNIDDLDLGNMQKNLIIVKLTPVSGTPDEAEAFKKNDEHIGEVVRKLNKRGLKYSAMYTAESSVQAEPKERSLKRHLLAADNVENVDNGTFVNVTGCMFYYLKSMTVFMDKGGKNHTVVLDQLDQFEDASTCGNGSATLVLKSATTMKPEITLTLEMSDHGTTAWNITQAMVTVTQGTINGTDFSGDAVMDTRKIFAPKDYSYHCSKLGPIVNLKTENASTVNISLSFKKFQLQPFNIRNDQFSDGWDCMVFFTEGIWMGIVSILILTIILLYGLTMLSSIKTMDKFDDAKGKTITVNVSE